MDTVPHEKRGSLKEIGIRAISSPDIAINTDAFIKGKP